MDGATGGYSVAVQRLVSPHNRGSGRITRCDFVFVHFGEHRRILAGKYRQLLALGPNPKR